jgi:predicted secreted protein
MAGFSALGTILRMSTAEFAETTTAAGVADLTNISGPTMSAEEIDVSSHDSTGNFREFVSGFLDAGELSLEGNLRNSTTGATTLVTAFNDRLSRYFHVVFPATVTTTGSTSVGDDASMNYMRWKLQGYVTGVETAAPYDDKASFSASIRITGAPILVGTSSSGS